MKRHRRDGRPTGRIRALLAIGGVLGLGAVSTLAAWTDDASATATFSSGSIDLRLNGDQGKPDAYKLTALNVADMKPGESTAATLPVQNKGTLPFSYRVTTTASTSNTFSGSLTVKITAGTVNGSGHSATCSGAALLGSVRIATSPVLMRTAGIAAGAAETLCIEVDLPAATDNGAQGQSTNVNFAFEATSK